MTWKVRSSNKMLMLGLVFFITGFISMTVPFRLVPFSPSDRLTIWLWAVLTAFFFGLGLFSIIVVKVRDAAIALLTVLVWSLIVLVPVPQGYEEPVYGGSLCLIGAIMILYNKYKELKKGKSNH